jgi:AraC family transcriptional regulator
MTESLRRMSTRHQHCAYGDQMAKYFHLNEAATLVVTPPSESRLAITRLKSMVGLPDRTASIPPERAFLIPLHLHPAEYRGYEIWVDGKHSFVPLWPAGGIGIYDLQANPTWRYTRSFDCVHFYLSRAALSSFTETNGLKTADKLHCVEGKVDNVLHHLAQMLLPTLGKPQSSCELFLDYFRSMLCAHVIGEYGGQAIPESHLGGGLVPWQKRRTKELLHQHLDGEIKLAKLADECGLSVSHFARSFKKSFGLPVHRYLISLRVEVAKSFLSQTDRSLTDVALQSGFSDQAAFCRTFRALVGTSPGRWRRERAFRKIFLSTESGQNGPAISVQCSALHN